ncbi:MAG: hypothetical protein BGO43_02810 [Gammaproteobacteria bacterium 39-13]|nr:hypothetical protein [Gammaproteobacteria bacterium]OJV85636.1 MAG: hypothetical protein BGO43_02810 [Gammaproteobacteria bacterium 39-13]
MKKRANHLPFYEITLHYFYTFYNNVYDFCHLLAKELYKSLVALKASWQPWIDRITNAIKGVLSFASTLKTSFQIMPIVLSTLTILSAAPLIHHILPSFLLEPIVTIPTLLAISIYAGYSTYRDLITREKLDQQITENKRINEKLITRISNLEKKLDNVSKQKNKSNTAFTTHSTNHSHYFLRNRQSKTNQTERENISTTTHTARRRCH